jgi:mono/diheme cytochrome c family protein
MEVGALSYRSDHGDPGYAAQLSAQQKQTEEFMRAPFQQEVSEPSSPGAVSSEAGTLTSRGAQIYTTQSCNACHGEGGTGAPGGPKLTGIHQRMSTEQLGSLLKSPTPKMVSGGMAPIDLPPNEMNALLAYLEAL